MTAEEAWNHYVKENPRLLDVVMDEYMRQKKGFLAGWDARKREEMRQAYTSQQQLNLQVWKQ